MNISLYDVSIWILPLLIAITFHEAAHAFVAYRLGDNTAWQLGRVSFNPIKHIDPFGTVILPGVLLLSHSPFLFGYAKPVPVNFRNLNHPRLDMVWVALATFDDRNAFAPTEHIWSRKRWPGCGSMTVYRNIRRRFPSDLGVLGYRH